jgi:hypothetical protein
MSYHANPTPVVTPRREANYAQIPVILSAQFWTAITAAYLGVLVTNQFLGSTVIHNLAQMSFQNPAVAEWVGSNLQFIAHPVTDAIAILGMVGSGGNAIFRRPR